MKIPYFVALSSFSIAVLANEVAAALPDEETVGALRVAMAQKSFPVEQFSQFTPTQIAEATPAALAAVADHTRVYRIDFDGDGAVDRVLQIDLHARNSEFIVLRCAKSGWSVVGDFFGEEFSFLGFGSLFVADLEITRNNGGGDLAVSTYRFEKGRYIRSGAHEERVNETAEQAHH